MLDLSIIIIHHRTPGFLKLCLDSIKKTVLGLNYELIVVDSITSQISKDIITERAPRAKFLGFKQNLGFSRGVNVGIMNSSAPYVLILNPDIIFTEDAVSSMLDFLKNHSDVGIVGPQLRNFNGTIQNSYFSYYRPITIAIRRSILGKWGIFKKYLDEFLMIETDKTKAQTPDWIMGSVMMVRREAINKVGLMDERFFMYFEDVDWARRFWHNGYKVIHYPKSVVFHYHQQESKSDLGTLDALFNKKTRWHIKSAIKFFIKYRNLSSVK